MILVILIIIIKYWIIINMIKKIDIENNKGIYNRNYILNKWIINIKICNESWIKNL